MSETNGEPLTEASLSGNGSGPHFEPVADYVREPQAERPEIAVGAAFLGGLLFAALLRRIRS